MNNIGNLDYSINATIKDNKLVIEYSGSVFKDNPSLVTKKTNNVMVKETPSGFEIEMNLKKKKDLNFSINNVNNQEIRERQKENLSLITLDSITFWDKIKNSIKKIRIIGYNKSEESIKQ